jgi:hypothetical protein
MFYFVKKPPVGRFFIHVALSLIALRVMFANELRFPGLGVGIFLKSEVFYIFTPQARIVGIRMFGQFAVKVIGSAYVHHIVVVVGQ